MEAEGVTFVAGVAVGVDLTVEQLQSDFDAVVSPPAPPSRAN